MRFIVNPLFGLKKQAKAHDEVGRSSCYQGRSLFKCSSRFSQWRFSLCSVAGGFILKLAARNYCSERMRTGANLLE